ncbi:MAG TPA: dihydrolipoyl dehydrogenase [Syntrophorhabdaceae bacterium]|nr:dihydrolipoyl dehydrogenase [Syntrophorhabdaceae bacterium]
MKDYDVIVVGSGSGLNLAYRAVSKNLKVALVASQYLGGTCMNVGCVPSKTLLYAADLATQIRDARRLGVDSHVMSIDFPAIMERMRQTRNRGVAFIRDDLKGTENLDFYESEGRFVDNYTIETEEERIRGSKVFIASGARPAIPPIKGLSDVPYLTNESVLDLKKPPQSIVIVGGSYIGLEYAHFFAAVGSAVSVVEYSDRFLTFEEPEISALIEKSMKMRMKIYPGHEALSVSKSGNGVLLAARNRKTGEEKAVEAETLLVAAGRTSNATRLNVERTGVALTPAGFIRVNDYLETSKNDIWALGDATGRAMFTHAADHEVGVLWHNVLKGDTNKEDRIEMNFDAVPHAVFTMPQIASVGLTEEAAGKNHDILVGVARYADIAQGDVRLEEEGFAKAIVEKGTERILGFHIIGPEASNLIQEVVNVVARRDSYRIITESMHIFPALSELIPETLNRLEEKARS